MKRITTLLLAITTLCLAAQQSDIIVKLMSGDRPAIAVPDFRATGEAQKFMDAFNQTLFGDLQTSGLFRMAPKSMYPLETPQTPKDFRPPLMPSATRRKTAPPKPIRQGPWLTDWSEPPVNANYLAFGYGGVQDGQLVIFGWLFNVTQPDVASAQAFQKFYFGSMDDAGARNTAHQFAADILKQFGAKSLAGSNIYFVSTRSGRGIKEIWSMDFDGANQQQLTFYKTTTTFPAVSPDGTRIAFTSWLQGNPAILVHSLDTKRRLTFYNQKAPLNAFAEFTPDGKKILYSSSITGYSQIYVADLDGSNLRAVSSSRAIEVEPKVNPRNPSEIVFISGRSGPPQLYKMNIDGADAVRLTSGEGDVANPAWHPDGRHVAFSWTKGYDPGNFNIFVMDVATQEYVQLTHGTGRNENPSWAPDGRHIAFASNRNGTIQIFTMLADGSEVRQLTTQGINEKPVWSK